MVIFNPFFAEFGVFTQPVTSAATDLTERLAAAVRQRPWPKPGLDRHRPSFRRRRRPFFPAVSSRDQLRPNAGNFDPIRVWTATTTARTEEPPVVKQDFGCSATRFSGKAAGACGQYHAHHSEPQTVAVHQPPNQRSTNP
jgi:hypothetical protein